MPAQRHELIVNMPCATRCPMNESRLYSASVCIGLKSPVKAANCTRSDSVNRAPSGAHRIADFKLFEVQTSRSIGFKLHRLSFPLVLLFREKISPADSSKQHQRYSNAVPI